MGTHSKRVEGAAEELGGKLKGKFGKLIGNEQMQVEGKLTELKGMAKQAAAKGADRALGGIERMIGVVRTRVGRLIDEPGMQARGRVDQAVGDTRQHLAE